MRLSKSRINNSVASIAREIAPPSCLTDMNTNSTTPELLCKELWRWESRNGGKHQPCCGYILRLNHKVYLIDPPADLVPERVREAVGPSAVNAIFLTHVQEEHGAGIQHYPQAEVHIPQGDAYLCRGEAAYHAQIKPWQSPWDWSDRGCFPGHLAGALNERSLDLARRGEPIEMIPGSTVRGFQVVSTPGHGKNAVTLTVDLNGESIGFCGDLIYGEGQLWNWFDCDWDYGPQTGQQTLLQSVRNLGWKSRCGGSAPPTAP